MSIDLAIVVGHSHDSPGAHNVDGVSERVWIEPLACDLAHELTALGIDVEVFYRSDNEPGYRAKMRDLTKRINRASPVAVLSLHFNAVGDPGPSDTGVITMHYPGSKHGSMLAHRLGPCAARAIRSPFRRILTQTSSWAGSPLYILTKTRAPACILEVYFGTDAEDTRRATEARDAGRLAVALASELADLLTELA